MTELKSPIHRLTSARRHEAGKTRAVVVSISPPAEIGFRLAATRQTYWLPVESGYELAVSYWLKQVEKRAREIARAEGIKLRSARVKARRELR